MEGSVVVRKVKVEASRQVVWMWRVVCGERGRGMDNCFAAEVGATVVIVSGADCDDDDVVVEQKM